MTVACHFESMTASFPGQLGAALSQVACKDYYASASASASAFALAWTVALVEHQDPTLLKAVASEAAQALELMGPHCIEQ